MRKICVFCGQRPYQKSREHVLPNWLIEITGSPKRFGFFGLSRNGKSLKEMHLKFDQFTFPACEICNREFGKIEALTKPIILDLLEERPLDNKDINLILTWLDKIRIGIWLGSLYYNNIFDIDPNFYINQGVFSRDRMILIFKNRLNRKGLNIMGNHYVFQMLPICFSLIINNFAIINLAKILLLAKGFGLAIPKEELILPTKGSHIKFTKGSQKINYPLVDITFDNNNCTEFYQPVLDKTFLVSILSKLNTEHIKKVFINKKSGIGKIFYLKRDVLELYPRTKSKLWIPPQLDLSFLEFFRLIGIQTLKIQNHYFTKDIGVFDPKQKPVFENQKDFALKYNNILLERIINRDFKEFKS